MAEWNPIKFCFSKVKSKFRQYRAQKLIGLIQDDHRAIVARAFNAVRKKDVVNCVKHVEKLLKWFKINNVKCISLFLLGIFLGLFLNVRGWEQQGIDIDLLLRLWRHWLLLALLEFGKGAKSRDHLSLLARTDRLGTTFQQLHRLARFLYGQGKDMLILRKDKNLLDKKGIDFNSLAQKSVMAIEFAWFPSASADILCSFACFIIYAK